MNKFDLFDQTYSEAQKAMQCGNAALAKKNYLLASDIMFEIAAESAGDDKTKKEQIASRLKNIANALKVNCGGQKNAFSGAFCESESGKTTANSFFKLYKNADLTAGFGSVIGLDEAKEAITQYVINPVLYPEEYNYNFAESNCILLEGPPGTGKTTFAKAVSKEVKLPFCLIEVPELISAYVGETAKNVDALFSALRKISAENGGVIVFFDEFDYIAKKSEGGKDKVAESAVPALKRNLDGMVKNKNFVVLANTNRKNELDSAILSRFSKSIYIGLPEIAARKKIYELKLKEIEKDYYEQIDFDLLSKVSAGLSGRDIATACDSFKYKLSEIKVKKSSDYDLTQILISETDKIKQKYASGE